MIADGVDEGCVGYSLVLVVDVVPFVLPFPLLPLMIGDVLCAFRPELLSDLLFEAVSLYYRWDRVLDRIFYFSTSSFVHRCRDLLCVDGMFFAFPVPDASCFQEVCVSDPF